MLDLQHPLVPYESPDGKLGEVSSEHDVHNITYNQQISNPTNQLLVPIIHWIDQTSSGTGNDLCLLKSPVIFTEPFPQTIKAWVYHGQNALPRSNCKATWAAILCYFLFPIDLLEFT